MNKAIVFDLYQTLVDFTSEDYLEQLYKMACELDVDEEKFKYYWNNETYLKRMLGTYPTVADNLIDICNKININTDYSKILRASDISLKYTKKSLNQLKENVEYTLSELKDKNYKIGLISDCTSNVPKLWNETILAKYFDTTIFSCNAGLKKPDSRIYHLLCKELNIQPSECYYVGDGWDEIIGAYNVGMTPVLICSKENEEKNFSKQSEESLDITKIFDMKDLLSIIG